MADHKIKLKKIPVRVIDEVEALESPDMPPAYPPSFDVNDIQMPEIKDWEVGKKYKFIIEVEQKSKNETKKKIRVSFDIIAYKYLKPKSIDEMTDEEFGQHQGESLHKASKGEKY